MMEVPMLSSISRKLNNFLLYLFFATPLHAATDTPVMNVSGQGSDYIFVYNGNDTTTFADLSALGNSIVVWIGTMTSYSGFGSGSVGDTLIVGSYTLNGDHLFLYTFDSDGNVVYPAAGSWYSFAAPAAPTPVYGSSSATTAQQNKITAALSAYASGAGETVEVDITGDSNDIYIEQAGGVSYIGLAITGSSNTFSSKQNIVPLTGSGSGHGYIEATIIGSTNNVDIDQRGLGNKATFLNVTGNSNDVDIDQRGVGDKFIDLTITGSNHDATIYQNGYGAHTARVVLDGSQPWDFELKQQGATSRSYTLPHTMSNGAGVSGTCSAIGGCNLTVNQN